MKDVTRILSAMQAGEAGASDALLDVVYGELRRLAAVSMAKEKSGQTLQPTALVHEAWLRLGGDAQPAWQNRSHFFGAAAEAMRRILVENARRKARLRHGGGQFRVDVGELDLASTATPETIIAVGEALELLARKEPQGADLIKLRFFVGLSNIEAARVLGLPERTAKRVWAYARAWLLRELRESNAPRTPRANSGPNRPPTSHI
ncbi:MAG: RNA polymerase subunit sigma [Verrucomicrobiales bacterium]|nr:RNA polymerase subunit sigma [Verrucomicrobiales bacterium]